MSIRYQLFTVVRVTSIIMLDVFNDDDDDDEDGDEDDVDNTCCRYVKPRTRLLSPRQFYVSNLTC